MRFRLGPQQAGTVRITRGSPKLESITRADPPYTQNTQAA